MLAKFSVRKILFYFALPYGNAPPIKDDIEAARRRLRRRI
jgi:hypothetical protein